MEVGKGRGERVTDSAGRRPLPWLRLALAVAALAAWACEPSRRVPDQEVLGAARELWFRYAIEIEDRLSESGLRRAGAGHVFRSGERFRVAIRADFEAFAYLLNRGAGEAAYQLLFPGGGSGNPIPADQELRMPGDGNWLRLDRDAGIEHLVLVVSSEPRREIEASGGAIPMEAFEEAAARIALRSGPASRSSVRQDGYTEVFLSAERGGAAVVERLPVRHRD